MMHVVFCIFFSKQEFVHSLYVDSFISEQVNVFVHYEYQSEDCNPGNEK